MQTIVFEKKDVGRIVPLFFNEEIIALPTDTVMGFACLASSEKAMNKLRALKGRDEKKAFAIAVPSVDTLYSYAKINKRQRKIVDAFLPGSLTIVCRKQENVASYVTLGKETIALRVVDDEWLNSLIPGPIFLTSANEANEPPLHTSDEVYAKFNEKVRGIVKGESLRTATTVVDLTGEAPVLLREGAISLADITRVWEEQ